MPFDDTLADRIRECLDRRTGIHEMRLFGCACFMPDGNMPVGVWKESLVARVGPDEYEGALPEPHVRVFDTTGR